MAPAPKYDQQTQRKMILAAAEQCINEASITDFTMAKIARIAGLSMGSVYKFVQSKEDIVLALANESFTHLSSIFDQVLGLELSAPEKIIAISLISPLKLQLFEFDYALQTYATNEAVIKKGSTYWTGKIIEAQSRCESSFKLALVEAINAGELEDVPNLSEAIEEIIISGWAMTVGYEQVQRVQQTKQIIEGTDSLLAPLPLNHPIIRSSVRLLNSYPWRQPINDASLKHIEQKLIALDLR
ncbi:MULTISPECIES: TetR/AcrR family transcriptional regulator [Pseudoalteromonas]|uniref:TetR/AcrR family transcriptional regulator n=1 Tax=Pseudoalteromonas obscura TaxID=3048491 RepID=A0ABT7EMB3_9GAMM|nr:MULTISPECIES: TetR/AcrR family transcriptional regulator [Pseudoalteromonas]MBQ4837861.1 TetR/AcrR family transcriptional regulator [Pseudoalteromonas luteoviolacea]MDK2596194.1 TetR/AcrR family transcriptional regulator [Pseudoalteromonas sp. P94(2023)]